MFDMSWGEIMVIGGVALVVIGPKDLPRALRTLGQMTTKVRRLAGEFHGQFNEAMREAELDDVKKEVDGLNRSVASATAATFNPIQTIRDELKSSIEGRTASATAPYPAASHPAESTPVADLHGPDDPVSQVPMAEPLPEIYGLNPESQPLVPLPADEPVAPATAALDPHVHAPPADPSPDPTRLLTGPGLEPVVEPEMPLEARA